MTDKIDSARAMAERIRHLEIESKKLLSKPADKSLALKVSALEREIQLLKLKESPGAWQYWTPTVTGWATISVSNYKYTTVGKFVFVTILIQGVSNSTSIVVTLPKPAANYGSIAAFGYGYNNGAALSTPCYLYGFSATEVRVIKDPTGAPWTGSNGKRIIVQFGYEAA